MSLLLLNFYLSIALPAVELLVAAPSVVIVIVFVAVAGAVIVAALCFV